MAVWKIAGEAGKALDATQRELHTLGIQSPVVKLASLDDDSLVFRQVFATPAEASGMEPAQQVSLWRDGVRFFQGHITSRKSRDTEDGGFQVDTTCLGPWWWLENTPLSGDVVDGSGKTVERMQFSFAAGDLKVDLTTLINRFITLGCPIQLGTIDNCFEISQITLPGMSCADSLAEMLRWLPDAVVWFDYSVTSGTGHPALNITRRISASTLSLTAGAAPVAGCDINPRLDLQVDQVRVLFARRNVDEEMEFVELSSGHSGTAQAGGTDTITLAADASTADDAYASLDVVIDSGAGAGQTRTVSAYDGTTKIAAVMTDWTTAPDATSVYKVGSGSGDSSKPARQLITVSGPEVSDFLPKDYFDNETVRSKSIASGAQIFKDLDPQLLQIKADTGYLPGLSIGTDVYNPNPPYQLFRKAAVSPAEFRMETGETLGTGLDYYLIKGEARPWFKDSGYASRRCSGRATIYMKRHVQYTTTDPWDSFSASEEAFARVAQQYSIYPGEGSWAKTYYWFYESSISFWAVDQDWPSDTTVYRGQDYGFVYPPPGLATNLLAAQDWVPYEGEIRLRESEIGTEQILGRRIDLANSLPEHAAMGALPVEVEHDIDGLATTVYLGAPSRLSYKGLVGRFRQAGRDNIVHL